MKFDIDKSHRDFFQKHGFIEFENIIPKDQIMQFNQAIDQSLENQLDKPFHKLTSEQIFLKSRDLWRFNDFLKQLTIQVRLSGLVSEMIEKKPVRLGYTQFFPSYSQQGSGLEKNKDPYSNFLHQKTNLVNISSLSNVLCGLMVCLSEDDQVVNSNSITEEVDIFSCKLGSVIIFQAETIINLECLLKHYSQRYYLIVYTENSSYYFPQSNDPFNYFLKHVGYVYNDKLSDKLNPIVYR